MTDNHLLFFPLLVLSRQVKAMGMSALDEYASSGGSHELLLPGPFVIGEDVTDRNMRNFLDGDFIFILFMFTVTAEFVRRVA